jgi:hypothetical protein
MSAAREGERRPKRRQSDQIFDVAAKLRAEGRELAQAVIQHFRHCYCDSIFPKSRPCLFCRAKRLAEDVAHG